MRTRCGCGLHDRQGPIERLIVVPGHFRDDERRMIGANLPVSYLDAVNHVVSQYRKNSHGARRALGKNSPDAASEQHRGTVEPAYPSAWGDGPE